MSSKEKKVKKFLDRNVDMEFFCDVPDDHVIISKRDFEAVETALAYGRIKVINEQVVSNLSFQHQLDAVVHWDKPLKEGEEKPTPVNHTIVGRIDWLGYENDYLILKSLRIPLHDWNGDVKQEAIQVPESEIVKVK